MSKSVTTEAARRELKQQKKEAEYRAAVKKLPFFSRVALCVTIATLLLFFTSWAQVYNVDISGPEVAIDGWACVASGVTGVYMSPDPIFKDMAMPFYYYASEWAVPLATATLLACIAVAVSVALHVYGAIRPNLVVCAVSCALNLAAAVLLAVCFFTAIGMKNGSILSVYCGGNPACSIRSYALVPAFAALIAALFDGYAALRHARAKQLLK